MITENVRAEIADNNMTQIIRHTSRTQETITRTVSTVVTNGNATSVNGSDTVGKIGTNEIPAVRKGMAWYGLNTGPEE